MTLILAGIGTEVGKTVVSAIFCQALKAHYWKPVQAGDLDHTDTDKVSELVTHSGFKSFPEVHRLTQPMSPHAAAERDGIEIHPDDFKNNAARQSGELYITELAGGLMVPLSSNYMMVDLVQDLGAPIILVANSYLGSINHTLLSLELIAQRQLDLVGIVFNGKTNMDSRNVILKYTGAPLLADIPHTDHVNKDFVKTHADKIQDHPRLARFR